MRLFLFLSIFLSSSIFAVAQQLDTLLQFDYRSHATQIELDLNGDLIVLGNRGASTSDSYYHKDGFLIKYDQEGSLIWEQTQLFGSSEFSSMTVTPNGDVYVSYYDDAFYLEKYNNDGELLWEKVIYDNGSQNFRITPDVLHADEDHLYMGAHYYGKGFFELDSLDANEKGPLVVIQYDLDGNPQWLRNLKATSGSFTGMDSDEEGDVYFSTVSFNYIELDTFKYFGSGQVGAVGKLSVDGETEWLQPFAGIEFGHVCNGIMVDKLSNVFAVGTQPGTSSLVKYNQEGGILWVSSLPNGSGLFGGARWSDVWVNDFGEIYTVGYYSGTVNFGIDILVGTDPFESDQLFAKFNNKGEMLLVKSIPGGRRDVLVALTGNRNKIYMAGFSDGVIAMTSQSIPFENYLSVLKYEDKEGYDPEFYDQEFSLFPNPNTGQFCVFLNAEFQKNVEISAYDMLGRLLYNQHYDTLSSIHPFVVVNLSESVVPGHYILNVKSGDKEQSLIFAVY